LKPFFSVITTVAGARRRFMMSCRQTKIKVLFCCPTSRF